MATAIINFFYELIYNSKLNSSPYRSISLRTCDLASIVGWSTSTNPADANEKPHFLLSLQKQMAEDIAEDKEECEILERLNKLISTLDNTQSDEVDISEPNYPQPEGIVAQYNARPIFVLSDEYIESDFNISCEQFIDNAMEIEKTSVDLSELMKLNLPADINVISECKRLLHLSASPQSNRERTTTAPCFRTRRVEVEPTTGRPEKKIYGN